MKPTALQASLLVTVVVLLAAWLYLSAEWRVAGEWGYALDDSWIHATFARNFATGHGFSFNPGEKVSGATGPLYTFILALFYLLFHEVIWSAKIFGIVCHIGASLAIHATLLALLPGRHLVALAGALLVASAPPLVWGMLTGMEIALYAFLLCLGLAFYARGRRTLAVAVWAVGVWVRPDGLFLVALGMLGRPKEVVRRAAVVGPILLAFFAFNYAIGGHWMPQTVTTKSHLHVGAGNAWHVLRECGELWGIPYRRREALDEPAILLPFLLLGALLTIRKWPLLASYVIGFPLALSVFQGGTASEKRYALYILPVGMILVAMAWDQIDRWTRSRWRYAAAAVATICLVAQAFILPYRARFYGWNVHNINKMQITLAKFARLATQPGDAIAVNDVGAMGYFSDRYVVDLIGLVTPPRSFPENLSLHHPRLLIIFVTWFDEYAQDDPATGNYRFYDADSLYRYELLAGVDLRRNTICGGNRMAAYVRLGKDDPSPTKRWLYVY